LGFGEESEEGTYSSPRPVECKGVEDTSYLFLEEETPLVTFSGSLELEYVDLLAHTKVVFHKFAIFSNNSHPVGLWSLPAPFRSLLTRIM
jgi:hypothetical protein